MSAHCARRKRSFVMSWVIVGLGNPGEDYAQTRHNTGRMLVEHFAREKGFSAWKSDKKIKAIVSRGFIGKTVVALVLPDAYMNKAGLVVSKFVQSARAAKKMVIVYDDLDLPLGTMRISFDRGSGGHKGVESVARAVKTRAFARVRIGISPRTAHGEIRKPDGAKQVEKYILDLWKPHELTELKRVFTRAVLALETIIGSGVERAMNRFNSGIEQD